MSEIAITGGLSMSPSIGDLVDALAKARKKFKPVIKDSSNPFFKSKYADLAGAIEATSEALAENGLVVIQSPRLANGHACVTSVLAHSSGQWIKDELELPVGKFDAQGVGSAITYGRRYAYLAIIGVAAEDDDGNAAAQTFQKQPDGTFAKPNAVNVPNPPNTVVGKLPAKSPENVPAKRGRPSTKKDSGEPWGGEFQKPAEVPPTPPSNVHGVTITDNDLPENLQPKPEDNRLATEAERKVFMNRLIALKDKSFTGIREYLLKESKQEITNNIPYGQMESLVSKLEAAEKDGTLKSLLS